MKTSKNLLLSVCGFAIIGILAWSVLVKRTDTPFETVQISIKPVKFDANLNYLVSQLKSLGSQLPKHADFASNVIHECESMRSLFTESFQSPVQGSIDFILQVHPNYVGGLNSPGYDPERSRGLVSKIILENKYDIVTFEGSGFNGFSVESRLKEVLARLKYQPESPLYQGLVQKGIDPSSYEQARPHLLELLASRKISGPWDELEKKTATSFMAGESVPLTILMAKIMSGEIGHSDSKSLIENVQRLRSEYALAKTIKDLKAKSAKHAAIVFGFLHEKDFKNLASALGINAKVYNATGVEWEMLRVP
ncbi:MAG: hypothetical protein Q7R65_01815 [bacterium]|nr:hypothetical protein [bacterium]